MSELDPILDSLFQAPFAHPLSLGQLERRRVQRRRQRMTTRLAAVACAMAAVFAVSRAHSASTHTLHTIDGGDRTPPTVATSLPGVAPGEPGAAPIASTSSDNNVFASRVAGAPLVADTTTTAPGTNGCAVESEGNAVDVTVPGYGGAGFGSYERKCEFTATEPGGYVAHGTWRVNIERGGRLYGYSSQAHSADCGPVGAIEVGDHVTLIIDYGSEAVADPTYVRAGPDQHC